MTLIRPDRAGATRTTLPDGGYRYDYPDGIFDSYDKNGLPHAPEDTPASHDTHGSRAYACHGDLHRRNGPAIEHQDSNYLALWFLDGTEVAAATVVDAWLLEHGLHPTAAQRDTLLDLCTPWMYGFTLEFLHSAAIAATDT